MNGTTGHRPGSGTIKHALVADDEKHTRVALALILRRAGYEVTTVDDGHEALRTITGASRRSTPFDLLVIAVQMPGLTGIEVAEAIGEAGATAPTLLITGYRCPDRVAELRRSQCLECAEKPFSPEEFLQHVSRLLARAAGEHDGVPAAARARRLPHA
jgi:CheY-like chemotaxis protein